MQTNAKGNSLVFRASMACSSIKRAPLVATMTGSTTIFLAEYCFNLLAMVSINSCLETIPILTASGKISVKMASSSWPRNSGVALKISVTPVVFCAVKAVMALVANTPLVVIVLISAWIPAPPLESEPAIVHAVNIKIPPLHVFSIAIEGGVPNLPLQNRAQKNQPGL